INSGPCIVTQISLTFVFSDVSDLSLILPTANNQQLSTINNPYFNYVINYDEQALSKSLRNVSQIQGNMSEDEALARALALSLQESSGSQQNGAMPTTIDQQLEEDRMLARAIAESERKQRQQRKFTVHYVDKSRNRPIPAPKDEDEMMVAIFECIDRLFRIVRPRKLLYMAIDGVAPRAKMNQQRSRRFRASKETVEKIQEVARIRSELAAKGYHLPPEKPKGSNLIATVSLRKEIGGLAVDAKQSVRFAGSVLNWQFYYGLSTHRLLVPSTESQSL
ncbi:hypothetical protein C0J52_26987, partial [Blattella germanica]